MFSEQNVIVNVSVFQSPCLEMNIHNKFHNNIVMCERGCEISFSDSIEDDGDSGGSRLE